MSVFRRAKLDLISRAKGPAVDWTKLLVENGRWLRTVASARLGGNDLQAVDDVFQEVALAVCKQSDGPDDPTKVLPWLYRLTVRLALLHRRKQGRRNRLIERHAHRNARVLETAQTVDPLDWLIKAERAALVREALGRLNGRDSEILLLKYAERWTNRELADRLELTLGAIDARLHRARGRLRAELLDLISEEVKT